MNIKHEGKTYEVLTIDRISEITHAKLAGGAVTTAKASLCGAGIIVSSIGTDLTTTLIDREIEDFAVQPLRLVPKELVAFEEVFFKGETTNQWYQCFASGSRPTKRFRCVEIVEEA